VTRVDLLPRNYIGYSLQSDVGLCQYSSDNQSREDWNLADFRNVIYVKYTSDNEQCPT
jgi:hypothetical protein